MIEPKTRALCVFNGALVICEFSKRYDTFINALGKKMKADPVVCPQCRKSTTLAPYRDDWLWCSNDECDFQILKQHYEEILTWVNDPDYETWAYMDSIKLIPIGETSF